MEYNRLGKDNLNSRRQELLIQDDLVYVPVNECSQNNNQVTAQNHPHLAYIKIGPQQKSSNFVLKLVLPVIAIGLLNLSYMTSLDPCPSKPANWIECKPHLYSHYKEWIVEDIIAAGAYFAIVYMSIANICHMAWAVLATLNVAYFVFSYKEFRFADHGGFSRLVFALSLFIITVIFVTKKLVTSYRKYIPLALIIVATALSPFVMFYYQRVSTSVDGWDTSIGGKKLINDGQRCTVPFPDYSELQARRGLLDINHYLAECSEVDHVVQRQTLPEPLRNKTSLKTIGYPRVENYTNHQRIYDDDFMRTVASQIIDMDDETIPQEIKDNIEFTVNMTHPYKHDLHVNLKPNATRAEEQKKLRDKIIEEDKKKNKTDRIDKNVFIFYIDNFSRAHFKRKLPKTVEWLSKYVGDTEEDFELFQFFRYSFQCIYLIKNQ